MGRLLKGKSKEKERQDTLCVGCSLSSRCPPVCGLNLRPVLTQHAAGSPVPESGMTAHNDSATTVSLSQSRRPGSMKCGPSRGINVQGHHFCRQRKTLTVLLHVLMEVNVSTGSSATAVDLMHLDQDVRQVNNDPECHSSPYSCKRSVSLFFSGDEQIKMSSEVTYKGFGLQLPSVVGNLHIQKLAGYFLVRHQYAFTLAWDGVSAVYIKMAPEYLGKTHGLCGNNNAVLQDDLETSYGKLTDDITEFVESWQENPPQGKPAWDNSFLNEPPCLTQSHETLQEEQLGIAIYFTKSEYENFCFNFSTCSGGKWICTNLTCPAECSVSGDIHFMTFDGREYTFQAPCQYILAKSRTSGEFTVSLQNAPCGQNQDGSCIQSISIILKQDPKRQVTLTHSGDVLIYDQYKINLPYADGIDYPPGDNIITSLGKCHCSNGVMNCDNNVIAFASMDHFNAPSIRARLCVRRMGIDITEHSMDLRMTLLDLSTSSSFSVVIQNINCFNTGIICRKEIFINVGKSSLIFDDETGNPSSSSHMDKPQKMQLWKAGFFTVVHFPDEHITILWDQRTTVHVQMGHQWQGELTGLCGNFDLKTINELRTPDNFELTNSQEFGNSWTAVECVDRYDIQNPCSLNPLREPFAKKECGILFSEAFEACHPVIDVTWFYSNCLADTCGCNQGGDCECFCTSVSAYAHQCCQHGVSVDWRTPRVCPYDCEYFNKALGKGPYKLLSYINGEFVMAAKLVNGFVFPVREDNIAPGHVVSFMLTSGLYKPKAHDSNLVSFEAAERPNYFLQLSSSNTLVLSKWEKSEEFHNKSTFVIHKNTWLSGYSSFESFAKPGYFIHMSVSSVELLKYHHSEEFRLSILLKLADVKFLSRSACEWHYDACASPCFKTCRDPLGKNCQTLPKIEGCIPACPLNMLLDEVTQRCVYFEDCIEPADGISPLPPSIQTPAVSHLTVSTTLAASSKVVTSFPLPEAKDMETTPASKLKLDATTEKTEFSSITANTTLPAVTLSSYVSSQPIEMASAQRRTTTVPVTLKSNRPEDQSVSSPSLTRSTLRVTTTPKYPVVETEIVPTASKPTLESITVMVKPTSATAQTSFSSSSGVKVPAETTKAVTVPHLSTKVAMELSHQTTKPSLTSQSSISIYQHPEETLTKSTDHPQILLSTTEATVESTLSSSLTTSLPKGIHSNTLPILLDPTQVILPTEKELILTDSVTQPYLPRTTVWQSTVPARKTADFAFGTSILPSTPELFVTSSSLTTIEKDAFPSFSTQKAGTGLKSTWQATVTESLVSSKAPEKTTTSSVLLPETTEIPIMMRSEPSTGAFLTTVISTASMPTVKTSTEKTAVLPKQVTFSTTAYGSTFLPTTVLSGTARSSQVASASSTISSTGQSITAPSATSDKTETVTEFTTTLVKPTYFSVTSKSKELMFPDTEKSEELDVQAVHAQGVTVTSEVPQKFYSPYSAITTAAPSNPITENECITYICLDGQVIQVNKSQNCPYNATQPSCGVLGYAAQINGDKCCPKWECACRCTIFSDLSIVTYDGNHLALFKEASYIVSQTQDETITIHILDCRMITVNSRFAWPTVRKYGYKVEDSGFKYAVETPTNIKIQWFHSTGVMIIEFNTTREPKALGLCGFCDRSLENDLMLPNRTVLSKSDAPSTFIDSWQVPDTLKYVGEDRHQETNCSVMDCSECLRLVLNQTFSSCHPYVPPEIFCDIWVQDTEYIQNPCVSLAAYVAMCNKFNICIEWRSDDYCPFACSENFSYQACIAACEVAESCQNNEVAALDSDACLVLTEGCVCAAGSILHRAHTAVCIPEEKCACTDSSGAPHAVGDTWKTSLSGCCMEKCVDSETIIPVEYNCSDIYDFDCQRFAEVVLLVPGDDMCCPQKICKCDPAKCEPMEHVPSCQEDQTLIAARVESTCCISYICDLNNYIFSPACGACSDQIPKCQEGEVLIVDDNTTERCCPTYQCKCACEMIPKPQCKLGQKLQIDEQFQNSTENICNCVKYKCVRDKVCLSNERGVLLPGQTIVEHSLDGICRISYCTNVVDPSTKYYRINTTSVACAVKCKAPGSTWISNCMRYECINTAIGSVLVASSVGCPPFNETECVKVGGYVVPFLEGCCKTCKEDGKFCKKVTVRMTIRKNDCRSNTLVSK
ncbi:UNVERIFIED_CONTAM: hypothetical protein H355_016288 [Colinus virginianus]|nr:hypothetical protein H355_016288 [Colinus virginianus]